jgi:S1-C subfamily serine protease
MTSSQWLDTAVLAVAFIAAFSGWRSGALGSLLSFVGVALGAVAGVLLAPYIVEQFETQQMKLVAALFLILSLVIVGEVAGLVLGRAVRGAIHSPGLRSADSLVGVALQLVVVLMAAYLLAAPLTASDQPNLVAAVRGSRVLGEVNDVAPDWLRTVPRRISALLDTSGLPDVLDPFTRTPIAAVEAPDAELIDNPVVEQAEPSVVKIRGVASSCQKVLEGTGFVVADGRVMTNAHVVAGADSVAVETGGKSYEATVTSFDPDADISILAVPDLPQPPLKFVDSPAKPDTGAILLGYPGGGGFEASPARIREIIELNGPDIYQKSTVTREVYTVRGTVRQGNSGGPLINLDGRVLGVVFGEAIDDAETGFVLTAKEVARQMAKLGDSEPVPTQGCVTG